MAFYRIHERTICFSFMCWKYLKNYKVVYVLFCILIYRLYTSYLLTKKTQYSNFKIKKNLFNKKKLKNDTTLPPPPPKKTHIKPKVAHGANKGWCLHLLIIFFFRNSPNLSRYFSNWLILPFVYIFVFISKHISSKL